MRWKSLYTALAGLLLGLAVITLLPRQALFVSPTSNAAASVEASGTGERWACPMMDYIGTQPGDCPVCGMKLQRVTAGELNQEQQRRMGVDTTKIIEGPAVVAIRAHGTADYDHRFTHVVIPRIAGRIVKRYDATFGCCQEVAAGDPIVDLYSAELVAAQGELAAAVKLGQADLVDALRTRFAQWNLGDLASDIANGGTVRDTVTIRSPFDGQVLLEDIDAVNESLEVGREVTADTPLIRLVDPNRLTLVVQVPETRARFLSEGQSVDLESDELGPLPKVKGVIGRLAQEIDPSIRTREVRIYVTGAREVLQPGSLITARIRGALDANLQPADPLLSRSWARFPLVPKTAILSTGVRNVVWRVAQRHADGRVQFELASVGLGPRLEDENGHDVYIVRSGLQAGDEVATRGAFLIDSQAQLAGTPSLIYPHGAAATGAAHSH